MRVAAAPVCTAAAASVAAGSLLLSGLAFAPSAQAAPAGTPQEAAGDWLEGQLTDGLIFNPNFGGFTDYGLTVDTGLALKAIGGHKSKVTEISDALAADIDLYITGDATGDPGSTYAGATAKSAAFALRIGVDPKSYGGVNLISTIKKTLSTKKHSAGRITDTSTFGDFANTIGQGFAVEALSREDSGKADEALDFLLQQQCTDGFFRLSFDPNAKAKDQTCDGGTADESAPDTDVTALVMLNLLRVKNPDKSVTKSLKHASKWLHKQQGKSGQFGGGPSTEAANSNSTGLAGWALGTYGSCADAAQAARWVAGLQVGAQASGDPLEGDEGAIAYDDAALTLGATDGITDESSDQWRRATAQAAPALRYAAGAAPSLKLKVPSGFVQGGSKAKFKMKNVPDGSRVCLSGRKYDESFTGTGDTLKTKVDLAKKTGVYTYMATSLDGDLKASVSVLGKLDIKFKRDKVVGKGDMQTVAVRGLEDGEKVRVIFGGVKVAKGKADADGKFAAEFKVTGSKGSKVLNVTGEFPDTRSGSKRFTVK